ncbi:MAG: diaminopimelate decarboxylase [Alphaproteobacteria bacterium]|nr:diaminopimelate decarboxylase [Alphaproteobacteria bacterium]
MHHFDYKNGVLHAEGVSLATIAEEVGTPVYVYSRATLTRHFQVLDDALSGIDHLICFAMKANSSLGVVATLAKLGAGADVVSEGEARLAMAAGIPPEKIVFSGVGKTEAELAFALQAGIGQLNLESYEELLELSHIAQRLGKTARIALRVNPDVDAGTHAKITTGLKENKFGIDWTQAHTVYKQAMKLQGIEVVGVAVHIGSQLTNLKPFEDAFLRLRDLVVMLKADNIPIQKIDLGGGLGVPYEPGVNETPPLPVDYAKVVKACVGDLGCKLVFEPGRLLVGNAGILLSRISRLKEGATRSFVVVDAGMNDLMRPALYDAYHDIQPVKEPKPGGARRAVDVVGPICESSDVFATQRLLPMLTKDELIAFGTAGAYGASMSSEYNGRPLVPEVMVDGDRFAVTRPRPSYEAMIAQQKLPDWMG